MTSLVYPRGDLVVWALTETAQVKQLTLVYMCVYVNSEELLGVINARRARRKQQRQQQQQHQWVMSIYVNV